MLFAENESLSWAQTGALGLLAGVLAGCGRLIWWLIPKAIEAHTTAVTTLASAVTEGAEAHKEAIVVITEENRTEKRLAESRCDKEHEKRDKAFEKIVESVKQLAETVKVQK